MNFFKSLSAKAAVVLASLVSIGVGLGTDPEVLKLLPPVVGMLISKAIIYGGGATVLYKMQPKQDAPK